MLSTFDHCLLLYVIRLAGWLKHCNLSLLFLLSTIYGSYVRCTRIEFRSTKRGGLASGLIVARESEKGREKRCGTCRIAS